MNRYQKQKRKNRLRLMLSLVLCLALLAVLIRTMVPLLLEMMKDKDIPWDEPFTEASSSPGVPEEETEALPETEAPADAGAETETGTEETGTVTTITLRKRDIYTFMQGPKAWEAKVAYSGSWCNVVLADQEFSIFGCGLCDLANIYSSLTPYDCSPLDMFYYAKEVSRYHPVSGYGAIDWPYLRKVLTTVGIDSRLMRKDETYEQFQQHIAESITVIALVCSGNDSTYWHNAEGHYVNLWLYDPEDDTVFLADSGDPTHNRRRIPLRYVYDALKTVSSFQYLRVVSVDPEGNTWQHDGIDIEWSPPKYYKK